MPSAIVFLRPLGLRLSQDGISLIQTAEGALNETHDILQRMRELAVQASNGTYTTSDRTKISGEASQLFNEINRIASQTEFNTKTLLATGLSAVTFHVGANSGQTIVLSINAMNATAILGVGSVGTGGLVFSSQSGKVGRSHVVL